MATQETPGATCRSPSLVANFHTQQQRAQVFDLAQVCYLTCRASPGSKPPCLTLGMLLVCACCRLKHTPITPFSGIDLTDVQLMQGQQDGAVSPQAHGAHPHTVLILVVSELFCHELFCASVLSRTAVLSRDSWDQRQSCSLHPAVAEAPIWCLCFGLKSG